MELKTILEALFFAAQKPLTAKEIMSLLKDADAFAPSPETAFFKEMKEDDIRDALAILEQDYQQNGRAVLIQETVNGFQLVTKPELAIWVRQLFEDVQTTTPRLSQPALETLAIIAYRQPISRSEIELVRGVAVDGVVATLLERKLIKIAGRSEAPGKPLVYETTPLFLEQFGLKSLSELPNADELKRMQAIGVSPLQQVSTGDISTSEAATTAPSLLANSETSNIGETSHEPANLAESDRPAGQSVAETAEPTHSA